MRKILLIGCTLGLLFGAPVQANEPPTEGTLSKIASTKSITLGYRDASVPFSYVGDQSGKPMGYSVDLANKIVERIQQKTGVANLSVKYNLVTSQTRIPLVQNGTVDLECGSTGVTAERQKQVAFSYGFIYVKGQLLTAKDSGIQGFADLKGKNVVTTAGTTNERFLKSYNAEHNGNLSVISAKDHGEAFKMLETGPRSRVLYGRCVALRRARQGQGPASLGGGGRGAVAGNLQLHGAQGRSAVSRGGQRHLGRSVPHR